MQHFATGPFCLLPDLLSEGKCGADGAGEGHKQDCCPCVQSKVIPGLGVGLVGRGGGLEGTLSFSVGELDGNGVLAQIQMLQEGFLQSDNGAAFHHGVVLAVDNLAVHQQLLEQNKAMRMRKIN